MAYTRAPRQKSPRIGPFRAGRPLPRLASTFIEVCPPRAHFPPLADAPPLGVPVPARGGYSRSRPIPDPIAGRGPWRSIQFPKSPRSGSKMRLRPWPAPRLGGSARRSPRARRASRPGGRRGRSRCPPRGEEESDQVDQDDRRDDGDHVDLRAWRTAASTLSALSTAAVDSRAVRMMRAICAADMMASAGRGVTRRVSDRVLIVGILCPGFRPRAGRRQSRPHTTYYGSSGKYLIAIPR